MFDDTIGVDISKDNLDVYRLKDGASARFTNDHAGHMQLRHWLGATLGLRCVYEPTGAYHAGFERYFSGQLALCKVNPLQARRFAQARGARAKTDTVDARMLALMGAALDLEPAPDLPTNLHEIKELSAWRRARLRERTALLTRIQTLRHPALVAQAKAHLELIDRHLTEIDDLITGIIAQDKELARRYAILTSIPGVGPRSAVAILIEMPELGHIMPKQCASLAGLAPMTRSSGRWSGQARIEGGRKPLRDALYMPALVATRHNKPLKAKYEALKARGKPAKLALTAIMRTLIEMANSLIKNDRCWSPFAT